MVAFSLVESATSWVEKCGFDFPLAVDTSRQVYTFLGLPRTTLIWTMSTLIAYAERLRAGVQQWGAYKGDDLHQMGGDYIVDSAGKLVYVYHGKTHKDRPTVENLQTALSSLSSKK